MLIKFLTYDTVLPMRMLLEFTLLTIVSDFPSLSTKLGNLICLCKSQTGPFFYCYGLFFTSCKIFVKLFNISLLQFPHLEGFHLEGVFFKYLLLVDWRFLLHLRHWVPEAGPGNDKIRCKDSCLMQRWHFGVGRQSPTALYSHSELWRLSWYSLHGHLFPRKEL